MAAFCPVHNKRWSELLDNQPHGKVEAYRVFNRNDKVIPEFGPFNTVEDVTSYLKTKYADQLSLHDDQLYIKTGGSYETYLKNISFIRKSIEDINKIYHDLINIDIQPIIKPSERFGIGRSKKAIVTVNQPALVSHYSVYNTPNITEDDAQRRAEGNWRVNDEGDVIPGYEQRRGVSEQLTSEERTDFEQKKAVMMKVFPGIKQVIEDYNIPQAGLLEGNGTIIRVNPIYMTRDTIGHEFGHLLIDLMGGMENPMIRAAREKLRGSPLEKRVYALYSDLIESDPDKLDKEVLAQAIGEETAKIFDTEADQNWWERFLMRFFDWLKRKLGIEKNEVRELARMVVGQRSIPYVVDPTIDESYEARVRNYDVVDEVYVSETEKLRRKALDSLKMKYSIYHRKDLPQKAEAIGDTLAKLEGLKDDPIESLKVFQEFAAEQTDAIYKQFKLTQRQKDYRKNPFAFKVRTLARWKDYVTSFDLLEEIVSVTRNAGASYIEGAEKLAEALNLDKLNETIQRKNEIQKAYKDEGLDLMVEFLLPHSTHIQAKYREIFEREYNKLPKDERKKITVEEYISQKLETSETDLSKETRLALRKELITAYGDVSQLTRWLDNMIDTPDLVTSAMVKAFAETDRRARQRQIEFKHELLDKQKKLEAFRSKGMLTKDEDFYDFFLERDEKGNLSGYSVDPYYNYMWSEYHKYGAFLQKKYEEGLISYDVMLSQKSNWKTENAPLNRKEFNKAKKEYLDQLLKDGYISAEERKALRLNDEIAKKAKRDRSLTKKIKRIDQIVGNDESAKMISTWVNENIPLFREPNKSYRFMFNEKTGRMERKEGGWLNPQWTKLVKIAGGNPNDPINKQLESVKANKTNDARIEFYNFIMAKNEEMQKNLPYMHRLRNRLPAIMKDFNQRLKAGDNIAELLKGTVKHNLAITSEYEERGERTQLTDESDNPVFFLPIYYTGDLDIKDQSFDVADIYFKYFSMAIDYAEKSTILPEMEMARFFVNDRDVFERDSKGNIVKKAVRGLRDRELTKKGYKSMIAAQLNDWFESVVYGKKTKDEGKISLFGAEVDFGRAIDMLNRYTALNLLGANFIQGTANVLLGSSLQLIESVGKEHYTPKNLAKANGYYFRQMPGILGDIGLREPENVVNLLNEKFDTLNEWIGTDFRKNTKFRQLMNTNTLFFTSHAGEHYMQTKVMLAMLDAMQAKDDKGNVLGSMMDVAKVKDGKLVFEGKNGEKVANFDEKAQFEFESKLKRLLSRLHGEYSEMGMVAFQRYALGRMGYMFRKFIVPGFRRRWGSKYVNNFSGDFTEGNYRTFGKFMSTMMKDLGVFRLSMWQTNWQHLTRMEKANVIRTIGEMAFLATAIIMASVFTSLKSKGGDDDEDWLYSFLGYQAMRLRAELAFFINPSETMKILRSPAASMSVIENTIKLFGQMLDPIMNGDLAFERYERGNWKGQLKINRTLVNFVPGVKQIYRLRDVSDQLNWLRQ